MTDESMEELFRTSDRLVGEVSMDFRRSLDVDWRDRLICITGARGARLLVGRAFARKTTGRTPQLPLREARNA